MKVIVLGSAAGGGFPQWNCRCANCNLAWRRDPRAAWRTQSSIAITGDDDCVLVNAAPEIGQQVRANPALWPRSRRHSPISTVVLTSAEIDHVAGLSSLRERHAFNVVALAPVQAAIAGNSIFAPLLATWITARAGAPFTAGDELELTLFPVPGKVPLYLEQDESKTDSEAGEASGLSVRHHGVTLIYIPGCAKLTDDIRERASRTDILLFDGTLFDDDELISAGLGEKTGRRMGHMPMMGAGGSLDWLASLSAARKIYTHINNTNPVLIEGSRERCLIESAGVEIACDGLELVL